MTQVVAYPYHNVVWCFPKTFRTRKPWLKYPKLPAIPQSRDNIGSDISPNFMTVLTDRQLMPLAYAAYLTTFTGTSEKVPMPYAHSRAAS
jgi:hypothetical protein